MKRLLRIPLLATMASILVAPGAHAQGCILCYTSLSGSSPAAMQAFKLGMFVLLIPALGLFTGVFLLVWYKARTATAAA